MTGRRITNRGERSQANGREFTLWDSAMSGFGVRVRPGRDVLCGGLRAGAGRGAPVRRYTIAAVGKFTPEGARARAKAILGSVAHGDDPAGDKSTERGVPRSPSWPTGSWPSMSIKAKASTAAFYRDILEHLVKPSVGHYQGR